MFVPLFENSTRSSKIHRPVTFHAATLLAKRLELKPVKSSVAVHVHHSARDGTENVMAGDSYDASLTVSAVAL